jgi:hypothetical protein
MAIQFKNEKNNGEKMKISILKPIVLGVLASAVITGCSSSNKTTPASKQPCEYNIVGGNSVKIDFGTLYSEPSVIATLEGDKVIVTNDAVVVNTNKLGIYEVTYTGESCENSKKRTIEVIPSSCAYKRLGASPIVVALNGEYTKPVFEVTDRNGKPVVDVEVVNGKIDFSKEDDYILPYQGKVCANNDKQTFKVKAKSTQCTYSNIDDFSVALNSKEIDLKEGVTITGSDGKEISSISISPDKVSTSTAEEYKVTYKGEGCSNEKTRVISVTTPVKNPVACQYELEGGNTVEVVVEGDYKDPEYSLKDTDGKPIEKGEIERAGEFTIDKIGEYQLTYKDSNCKDSVTRTVNVVAKECTYNFANDINSLKLDFGANYDADTNKPTVIDADGINEINASAVTVNAEKSETVDTTIAGTYKVVYEAKDCPNNGVMTVEVSPLSCTYTLKNGSSTVLKGNTYNDPGVSVTPEVKITTETIDTSTLGSKTITYLGEGCGESITRTVEVKELTEDELKDMLLPNI